MSFTFYWMMELRVLMLNTCIVITSGRSCGSTCNNTGSSLILRHSNVHRTFQLTSIIRRQRYSTTIDSLGGLLKFLLRYSLNLMQKSSKIFNCFLDALLRSCGAASTGHRPRTPQLLQIDRCTLHRPK